MNAAPLLYAAISGMVCTIAPDGRPDRILTAEEAKATLVRWTDRVAWQREHGTPDGVRVALSIAAKLQSAIAEAALQAAANPFQTEAA